MSEPENLVTKLTLQGGTKTNVAQNSFEEQGKFPLYAKNSRGGKGIFVWNFLAHPVNINL
jgi:hypothetical protein